MTQLFYIIAGFFLTLFGIKFFLKWSKKNNIFDIPNERSSHNRPTPVGGGLVIVSVTLGLFLCYLMSNGKEIPAAYFCGAVLIAVVSWLDDLYSLPVFIRFFCHSLSAIIVLLGSGIGGQINIPSVGIFELGNFVYLLWFLWVVWLVNAYNFMDGIDGIAGVQAVSAGFGWAFFGYFYGVEEIFILAGLIVAACIGFLIYNWQPSKIFMGDVGSSFLGFTFAVLPLFEIKKESSNSKTLLPLAIIFVWFFVFDSLLTFFIRLLKKEKVWQAHRSHFYQKLVIAGFSHGFVSGLYFILSLSVAVLTIIGLYYGEFNALFLYTAVGFFSVFLVFFTVYNTKLSY